MRRHGPPQTKTPDGFVATVNGSTAEIQKDPSDGLTLTTSSGAEIGIDLPFADTSNDGVKTKSGVVVYADAAPDVAVAAQPTPDGGMRALVVIDGPQAPTEYRFPMTLPDGAALFPRTDGGAVVIGADGQLVSYVAPAWAFDANGQPVPTRYLIEGTTLVQVIDHQGAAYPVTADPWWSTILATLGAALASGLVAGAVCLATGIANPVCVASFGLSVGFTGGVYKAMRTGKKGEILKSTICGGMAGIGFGKPITFAISASGGFVCTAI